MEITPERRLIVVHEDTRFGFAEENVIVDGLCTEGAYDSPELRDKIRCFKMHWFCNQTKIAILMDLPESAEFHSSQSCHFARLLHAELRDEPV